MKTRCPLCDGVDLEDFLVRHDVPVHQNLLFRSARDARQIARGDLVMAICLGCHFVFNRAFDSTKLQYAGDYENDQTVSPTFESHVGHLVDMLVREKGVQGAKIVEVGCGNGHFLRRLVASSDNRGVGFDPSYRGPDMEYDGRLTFVRTFYDAGAVIERPDVVLSRHVIEHVDQPAVFIDGIKRAIDGAPNVRLFLETPCVEWILRNQVIWDFFFEHCSLFTAQTLAFVVQRAGFSVESVEHVFGGQYLWLEASVSCHGHAPADHDDVVTAARTYGAA
jgi:2-polyprenyl-3-methyl-5-hydroxy-6-metoxy-1,4-benzoquinol methylase